MARLRWLSIVAVFTGAFLFAGCGEDDSSDSTEQVGPSDRATGGHVQGTKLTTAEVRRPKAIALQDRSVRHIVTGKHPRVTAVVRGPLREGGFWSEQKSGSICIRLPV